MGAYRNISNNNVFPSYAVGNQLNMQKELKMNNILSPEQIKEISSNGGSAGLCRPIEPAEATSCKCTHKNNGTFAIHTNADGTVTCDICHETFSDLDLTNLDMDEVNAHVAAVLDYLQTIKTYYVNMTQEDANLFVSIPVIKRIPEMLNSAAANYRMFAAYNPSVLATGANPINSDFIMGAIVSGNPVNISMCPGGYNQASCNNMVGGMAGMPNGMPGGMPGGMAVDPYHYNQQSQNMGYPYGYNNNQGQVQYNNNMNPNPAHNPNMDRIPAGATLAGTSDPYHPTAPTPRDNMTGAPYTPNNMNNPIGVVANPNSAPMATNTVTVATPDEANVNGNANITVRG